MCIETCGDGRRFSLTGCDDGNLKNNDGCSSTCLPESGFVCFGGTQDTKDTCSYLPTEIVGAEVNIHNDIILNFSRPVNFTTGSISNSDLKLYFKNQYGEYKTIDYKAFTFNLPSNYIYIKTYLKEDIIGGAYVDNILKIEYQNTGAIRDINGIDLKTSTYARVWFYTFNFFPEIEKKDAEFYGKLCLGFIFAAIAFWLTISEITNKTIMPAVFVFLAF